MNSWIETKAIARQLLVTWSYIPLHLRDIKGICLKLVGLLGKFALHIVAILLCLLAPLFFWVAPALVPIQRRTRAAQERAHQKALAELRQRRRGRAQRI